MIKRILNNEQDKISRKNYCIQIHQKNTNYNEDRRINLMAESTEDALEKARKFFLLQNIG